ncbi:ABC transporter permease [Lactococcus hodotermopsidis]|uniref:ABC transporter permease n=1 Tax=Pseudolactococcus hodotermopsidis TaxID=2709157 RepID=A0A6A0B8I0_9LACT|nr:ABC transporter permease [Lactococcus hodotermopsidis]GFH41700.1 ABC transporter permease [Lactococcus hodotermopsidis]
MDFIRRACLFSKAKIGRTLLLIVTFSAILIFVLSGLVIHNSAKKAIETAKKETGATVTLSVNREAMMKKAREAMSESSEGKNMMKLEMTPVKLSDATAISELSGVKSYNFVKEATATKGNIEPVANNEKATEPTIEQGGVEVEEIEGDGGRQAGGRGGKVEMSGMTMPDFTISGTNNLKTVNAFADGSSELTSGRLLTANDEKTNNVVIEADLAEANDLKVGSTFTITDESDKVYTLTVIGIFKSTASADSMGMTFNFMNPSNKMYTSLTFANTLEGTTDTLESATYHLENPEKSESFVKAAQKLVDTETYSVTSNDAMYQQMLAPLNNVAKFARNIVLLVAIAGTIILSLIVILTIRERRGEIGILMSMGESRFKIIGQFFVELFLVMLVAVGLAATSGNLVGNAIGSQLLSSQTAKTAETTSSGQPQVGDVQVFDTNGGGHEKGGRASRKPFGQSAAEIKEINELNVKMTGSQLTILAAIALGIIVVAIIIASLGIIRLNPKEILTGA